LSRTQRGNNNAYCQDNEISWTSWTLTEERQALLDFARRAACLMRDHPVLRRRKFFQGRRIRGAEVKDIMWLAPDGREMAEMEWNAEHVRCIGVRLSGDAIDELDENGAPIVGDTLLYLLNAGADPIPFRLPSFVTRPQWECLLDTADEDRSGQRFDGGCAYRLADHSLAVFRMSKATRRERR
jgi:glycogen operon protein